MTSDGSVAPAAAAQPGREVFREAGTDADQAGGMRGGARVLRSLGHEVVLIPPQYIKPYVKRGENDAIGGRIS